MHIDTSSIADRVNFLRPNITGRSQPFDRAAITNNDPTKSRINASDDIVGKRIAQFATTANKSTTLAGKLGTQAPTKSTTASHQQTGVGKFESEPGNPISSLLAEWGKSDSNYDLNGDGTVNTQDLLMLLEKLAVPANTDNRPAIQKDPNFTPVNPNTSDSQTEKPDNRIDALLADWGKTDSNYDLNADGTVNTQDLLMLLEKLAALGSPADNPSIQVDPNLTPVNPNTSDSQSDKPDNRIDALLADWGKTDSNYDLNADGTVNTQDLLMLLEKLAAHGSPADNPSIQVNPNLTPVKPNTSDAQTDKPDNRIDALLADWGKTDSNYDLNADGTVNTQDLLMLLEKLRQSNETPEVETPINEQLFSTPAGTLLTPSGSTDENVNPKIQQIARSISERLFYLHDQDQDGNISVNEAGNARAIFGKIDSNGDMQIDKLELANSIQDMLMGRLNHDSSTNLNNFISKTMQLFADRSERLTHSGHSDKHASVNRAYQRVGTDQAVNQLSQRLTNNGEAELRKFLATSDFTNTQKRSILSQLHNLNMGNLGVNMVG